jgi:hypothetical protein
VAARHEAAARPIVCAATGAADAGRASGRPAPPPPASAVRSKPPRPAGGATARSDRVVVVSMRSASRFSASFMRPMMPAALAQVAAQPRWSGPTDYRRPNIAAIAAMGIDGYTEKTATGISGSTEYRCRPIRAGPPFFPGSRRLPRTPATQAAVICRAVLVSGQTRAASAEWRGTTANRCHGSGMPLS